MMMSNNAMSPAAIEAEQRVMDAAHAAAAAAAARRAVTDDTLDDDDDDDIFAGIGEFGAAPPPPRDDAFTQWVYGTSSTDLRGGNSDADNAAIAQWFYDAPLDEVCKEVSDALNDDALIAEVLASGAAAPRTAAPRAPASGAASSSAIVAAAAAAAASAAANMAAAAAADKGAISTRKHPREPATTKAPAKAAAMTTRVVKKAKKSKASAAATPLPDATAREGVAKDADQYGNSAPGYAAFPRLYVLTPCLPPADDTDPKSRRVWRTKDVGEAAALLDRLYAEPALMARHCRRLVAAGKCTEAQARECVPLGIKVGKGGVCTIALGWAHDKAHEHPAYPELLCRHPKDDVTYLAMHVSQRVLRAYEARVATARATGTPLESFAMDGGRPLTRAELK